MFRRVVSRSREVAQVPEVLSGVPEDVLFSLDARANRGEAHPVVRPGHVLEAGQAVARGDAVVLHTPFGGRIVHADDREIRVACDPSAGGIPVRPMPLKEKNDLPDYALQAGLAGMGGGLFPYGRRLARGVELPLHTLVVNAVECEPGMQIDEALMIHQSGFVLEAVRVVAELLGLGRVVLGVRKSSRKRLEAALPEGLFDVLEMSDAYPGGAGKLLVAKLHGRMPHAETLNTDLGYWVMNVASLWALGRRIREGRPSVDRPLTLRVPGSEPRNLIVPLGVSAGFVLDELGQRCDSASQVLVAEGRMMGRAVGVDYRVGKGTLALMVLPRETRWERPEQPCILCGSCFDACPLKLHPIGMAERIREERWSRSLEAHVNECFLCGACSAVCPADIPLAHYFREGKTWLKNRS